MILSLTLVAIVAVTLLIPPLAFARAMRRYAGRKMVTAPKLFRFSVMAAAFIPLGLNAGYLFASWETISAGAMEIDEKLAMATFVSWLSFWGRVALGRRIMGRSPDRFSTHVG